jgi:carbamoyltransferase
MAKGKLFQKSILLAELGKTLGNEVDWESRLLFSEHHLSHAASAFYPSPFDGAAILTLDGVGEWTTTSWAALWVRLVVTSLDLPTNYYRA